MEQCSILKKSLLFGFVICLGSCLGLEECYAQEGLEYKLGCRGMETKNLRHIWWTINQLDDRKANYLSTCYPGTTECKDDYPDAFTARNYFTDSDFKSELSIHQVDPHIRSQVINCSVDDRQGYHVEQSCLMKVYYPPDSTECKAQHVNQVTTHVYCHTPKAFPGISCQIFRELHEPTETLDGSKKNGSGFTSSPVIATIDYTKQSCLVNEFEYYSAVCSAKMGKEQLGLHRFRIEIYPEDIDHQLVHPIVRYTNFLDDDTPVIAISSPEENNTNEVLQECESRPHDKSIFRKVDMANDKNWDNTDHNKPDKTVHNKPEDIPTYQARRHYNEQDRINDENGQGTISNTASKGTKDTMTNQYEQSQLQFRLLITFQLVFGAVLCILLAVKLMKCMRNRWSPDMKGLYEADKRSICAHHKHNHSSACSQCQSDLSWSEEQSSQNVCGQSQVSLGKERDAEVDPVTPKNQCWQRVSAASHTVPCPTSLTTGSSNTSGHIPFSHNTCSSAVAENEYIGPVAQSSNCPSPHLSHSETSSSNNPSMIHVATRAPTQKLREIPDRGLIGDQMTHCNVSMRLVNCPDSTVADVTPAVHDLTCCYRPTSSISSVTAADRSLSLVSSVTLSGSEC